MAMVDRVVAIVGIVLLVAAGTALVYQQEFAGLQQVTFPTSQVELQAQEEAAGSAPVRFEWNVSRNATEETAFGANVTVVIDFAGQALQGGSATVRLVLHPPEGGTPREVTKALEIPPGASSASGTFAISAVWASVPGEMRAQPADVPLPRQWDAPLALEVTVERPPDAGANLPAGVSYRFTATATPVLDVYAPATSAT